MKAAVFERYGPPEVLHVIDQPDPQPGTGEYLVRVHVCGLNHGLDGRTRKGDANRPIVFPHVLGTEFAGRSSMPGRAPMRRSSAGSQSSYHGSPVATA